MDDYDGPIYHGVEVDDNFEGAIYHVKLVGGGGGGDSHNKGYYATQSALEEAHPTAEAGDYAIVGATDTVWIWDTDNDEWVDSDQKGQVTSVNGQTGDVVLDLLPSQSGQSGKFLTTDGSSASWTDTFTSPLQITNESWVRAIKFQSVNGYVCTGFGLANTNADFMGVDWNRLAFVCSYDFGTIGTADGKWSNVYTTKINNGADITIPAVAGEMAVKQVNTTITLTAAGWSNGSQTVSVSGITSTGVVFVSPDPTDQADYVAAGILCTSQTTDSLTFTCDTTPSSDIDVVVVQM